AIEHRQRESRMIGFMRDRRRHGRQLRIGLHLTDEAKALARHRADQLLVAAVVVDRLAHGVDPAGQGRFGHDASVPDLVEQFVLADHAIAVLDEIEQNVEHLRLQRDALAGAAQLPPIDIKYMICKEKSHYSKSRPLFIIKKNQACLKAKSSWPQSL